MLTHAPYFTEKAFGWRMYVVIQIHDDEEHSKCDIKKKTNGQSDAIGFMSCHVIRLGGGALIGCSDLP